MAKRTSFDCVKVLLCSALYLYRTFNNIEYHKSTDVDLDG